MKRLWQPILDAMQAGAMGDRLIDEANYKGSKYYKIRFAVKQSAGGSINFSFYAPVGTPKKRARRCRDIALKAAADGLLDGHVAINRFIRNMRDEVKKRNMEDKQNAK